MNNLCDIKFGKEIMNIAYSGIGLAPTNSAEHFYLASHLGFNALKGDVRITSDDKLLMCHDAGVTLDENGYITRFNKYDYKRFLDYDYDYFKSLSFGQYVEETGYNAKLCDFETYARICKETGKILYATLRGDKIKTVVKEVIRIIRKYHMEEHCVINSFCYDTIAEVRKYSDTIIVSQVIELMEIPDKNVVDNLYSLGNSILTLFLFDKPESRQVWNDAQDIMNYASNKNIPVHMAQVNLYEDYSMLIRGGIQGFHLKKAFFSYPRTDISFDIISDKDDAQLSNILLGDRLIADVTKEGNIIKIKNIKKSGSGYDFDDGLPALWLNILPYRTDISCKQNPDCTIMYRDNTLEIDTKGIDGIYHVNVNI